MKIKKTKNRKSGSEVLVVKPTKHEELVYDQAEWLAGKPHPNLARFRYTLEGKEAVLYYDAYGLSDLKTYAKAPFGSVVYQKFLVALCELMALCTKNQLPTSSLRFTPDNILMSPDGTPYFLFIPLSNKASTKDDTPSALLQWISDRSPKSSIRFVVDEDERHADALFDYAKRNPVFSLTSFQKFLETEFGIGRYQTGGSGPISTQPPSSRTHDTKTRPSNQTAAAFDPMALLHNAPSASNVMANQSLANRVCDAVADISPTAAASPDGQRQPEQAPEPTPERLAGIEAAPAERSAGRSAPANAQPVPAPSEATSLLGAGVMSRVGTSVAQSFAVPASTYYLERQADGTRFALRPDEAFVVGRGSTCDIRIGGNSNVSRVHARIKLNGTALEIIDLGSSNGTFVENTQLTNNQSATLHVGGQVKFADETFVLTRD